MKIAILMRYIDMKRENYDWNCRLSVFKEFERMSKKLGVTLVPILSDVGYEELCSLCDGLIIPGSAVKVNPKYYGGEPCEPQAHDEFALDSRVIDCFVKMGKPILGICAGLQAINIYFGGTIGYIEKDSVPHNPHDNVHHLIDIKAGSFVHDVFKSDRAEINSYHKMHIVKLGRELDVVAMSEDGIIEAVEIKEKKIFATQWHPEKSFNEENAEEQKLFENFLRVCAE